MHTSAVRGAWGAAKLIGNTLPQPAGQCAVNFGPILLKLKCVTALALVVGTTTSPAAGEHGAPCYPT